MKNNEVLQKDVQDAVKWEPLMNASEIGPGSVSKRIPPEKGKR